MDWKPGYGTVWMIALLMTAGTVWYGVQNAPPEIPLRITHSAPRVIAPDPELAGLRVHINTATAEELEQLPGIGPGRAKDIRAYIRRYGRITTAEQLLEIPGIGEQTLTNILPYLDFQ